MKATIDDELCPISSGKHRFVPFVDRDAVQCIYCKAVVSGIDFALDESRRRIAAACTEPGNAPVGAPYPFNPPAEEAPMQATTPERRAVTDRAELPDPDGTCKSCKAPMRWAVTATGRRMPIDSEPNANGNIVLEVLPAPHGPTGAKVRALVIGPNDRVTQGVLQFRSHFATCSDAARFRGGGR